MDYKRINKIIKNTKDIIVSLEKEELKKHAEKIVVHHTATFVKPGDKQFWPIYRYHTQVNGWDGVGYNFIIEEDGTIMQARAVGTDLAAHKGFNTKYLAISLAGDFEKQELTNAQEASLKRLFLMLKEITDIDYSKNYTLHRLLQGAQTKCPGKNIDNEIIDSIVNDKSSEGGMLERDIIEKLIDKIRELITVLKDILNIFNIWEQTKKK